MFRRAASLYTKLRTRTNALIESRTWLLYVGAALLYTLATAYYMTPQFINCSDTVYGYGDNTGGPIWRNSIAGQPPLGGQQGLTGYPEGESTFSPVGASLALQSSLIWGASKVVGPVCGYNLVNIVGFIFSATVMFAFIVWLTKSRWLALLAGYAVSFAPYFQYKIGGHPGYGYAGILVAIIWLLLRLANTRRKRHAVYLGAVSAVCLYWDPYFTLLLATLLVPGATFIFGLEYIRSRSNRSSMFSGVFAAVKLPMIVAVTVCVLALPLVAVRLKYAGEIQSYVSGSRGDIMVDAVNCSIWPTDYLLPPNDNYVLGKVFGEKYSGKIKSLRHNCNPSEYTISLPLVMIGVFAAGGTVIAWERLNRRKLALSNANTNMTVAVLLLATLLLFAAVMALPPMFGPLRFPSFLLLKFVSAWRILAREFLIVNIAFVALTTIIMLFFARSVVLPKWVKVAAYIAVAFGVFFQFQAFRPLGGSATNFSFSRNIPKVVSVIKSTESVRVLAAYPLDKPGESENPSYYLTEQKIHGKPMINTSLPNSKNDRLYYSIKDLTDPQTLPILRQLGVDHVQINSMTREQIEAIPGLELVHYEYFKDPYMGGYVALAKVLPGPKLDVVTVLESGFPINATIMKSAGSIEYETQDGAVISTRSISSAATGSGRVCFDVIAADTSTTDTVVFLVNNKEVSRLSVGGSYQRVDLPSQLGGRIKIDTLSGANIRINNLGCLL